MKFYNDLIGIKQTQNQVKNPNITGLQLGTRIMGHRIEIPGPPEMPHTTHHAFGVEDFGGTKKILEGTGYKVECDGVRYVGQASLFIEEPYNNNVDLCSASCYAPPLTRKAVWRHG